MGCKQTKQHATKNYTVVLNTNVKKYTDFMDERAKDGKAHGLVDMPHSNIRPHVAARLKELGYTVFEVNVPQQSFDVTPTDAEDREAFEDWKSMAKNKEKVWKITCVPVIIDPSQQEYSQKYQYSTQKQVQYQDPIQDITL